MRFHEPRCEHATGRNKRRPGRVVWLRLSEERTRGTLFVAVVDRCTDSNLVADLGFRRPALIVRRLNQRTLPFGLAIVDRQFGQLVPIQNFKRALSPA